MPHPPLADSFIQTSCSLCLSHLSHNCYSKYVRHTVMICLCGCVVGAMCCLCRVPSRMRHSRDVCWIELRYWNGWVQRCQFVSGETFSHKFSDLKFMLPFLEQSGKYIQLYKYIYILLFLASAYLAIQYQTFYFQHLEHSGRFDY